jgi:hypothetical protein
MKTTTEIKEIEISSEGLEERITLSAMRRECQKMANRDRCLVHLVHEGVVEEEFHPAA